MPKGYVRCNSILPASRGNEGRRDGASGPVLLVAHVLQPIDDLAVEGLLDGDVRHRHRRARPVPVLHPGREPDHVTGSYLLDRAALLLNPAETNRDDERLPE